MLPLKPLLERKPPLWVIARSFPPSVEAGGSTVAYRLFKHIDPAHFVVLRGDLRPQDPALKLDARTSVFDIWPRRFLYTRYSFLFIPLLIATGLWFYLRLPVKPRAILAFYPFTFYTLAAFFLARFLRLPFSIFIYDVWQEAQTNFFDRRLAQIFEARILKSAQEVLVISDALKEHFVKKYGIMPITILHPIPIPNHSSPSSPRGVDRRPFRIVYTGNVSHLNLDSVRAMIDAVRRIEDETIQIHFYGGQSPAYLREILALSQEDPVHTAFAASRDIPLIQQTASLLFVGLAFHRVSEDAMRTTFPTKFAEYLAAGRPILAVAPPQSYLAQFIQQHKCAWLVDQPDAAQIAHAIRTLIADHELQRAYIEQARKTSLLFDEAVQVKTFANMLGLAFHPPETKDCD